MNVSPLFATKMGSCQQFDWTDFRIPSGGIGVNGVKREKFNVGQIGRVVSVYVLSTYELDSAS